MAVLTLFFGLSLLVLGSYYYLQSDPYPHHVYALPPAKKPKCTGAIPKIRTTPNPVDAPEPMQFTAQDQRAFIAISFKSGTPV